MLGIHIYLILSNAISNINSMITLEDKQKIAEAKAYISECRAIAGKMVLDKRCSKSALEQNQHRIDNATNYIRQIEQGIPEFWSK